MQLVGTCHRSLLAPQSVVYPNPVLILYLPTLLGAVRAAGAAWDPDSDFRPSGPEVIIEVKNNGFSEGNQFYTFETCPADKQALLVTLAEGKMPSQYSGGRCPWSVLVYDKRTSVASVQLALDQDLAKIQSQRDEWV